MTENLPSDRATKPGDVLTIRNGMTIEVLNTDAEGRLILADGLSLAVEANPDAIIDVATLTGAQRVALGDEVGAIFTSTDELADYFAVASARSGELLWRMPLVESYEATIESDVADMKNMGKTGKRWHDRRGVDPPALHRRASVGAPRHRRPGTIGRELAATRPRARRPSARARSSSSWRPSPKRRATRARRRARATPDSARRARVMTTRRRCRRPGRSAPSRRGPRRRCGPSAGSLASWRKLPQSAACHPLSSINSNSAIVAIAASVCQ